VGCYPITCARALIGAEPVEVFGWQVLGPTGVDEAFTGQMRFPGDVYAQFDCGFRAAFRMVMELIGDEGIISVGNAFKPGVPPARVLLTRGDQTETVSVPEQELYLGEVEDMADAILLGKPPRIPLADSRATVATIRALIQSAREGRAVGMREA